MLASFTPALRRELRATLALAWPLAGANLLQMAIYAVDVIFIARLGSQPLAAASLATSLTGLLMWCMTGMIGAAAPLIAAEIGRKRHSVREVRRSVRMGAWLGVASGVAAMAVCTQTDVLMRWTGQAEALVERTAGFVDLLMWTMIPLVLAGHLRNVVSALGRARTATVIAAIAVVVNALGNYALVFGNFGLPAYGLAGSAYASIVTSLVMLASYMLVLRYDRRLHRLRLAGRWWRPEWTRLRDLLRIGLPIAGTILAEAGLFSGAAFLMGRIGEAELAGHTIALQLAAIAFQVPFGIGQAAAIRVGLGFGAGDRAAIGRAGAVALVLGIGFMSLTALLMWTFGRTILRLYVDPDDAANGAMVGFALEYLAVAAAFQLFDGAQAVAAGALRGLQDTRVPMLIAVCGYWIPGMGTAIGLGFFTPLAGLGVWFGLAFGLVVVASLLVLRWRSRERLGLVPGVPSVRPAG